MPDGLLQDVPDGQYIFPLTEQTALGREVASRYVKVSPLNHVVHDKK